MKITKNHMPFLIAAAISVISIQTNIYYALKHGYSVFDIRFGWPFIIGAISLIVIALSMLINKKIWAYLFFAYLIACFTPYVTTGIFILSIFSIKMIPAALMVAHVALNIDLIAEMRPTNQDIENRIQQKKSIYETQFQKKSLEELKNIDMNELTIEARVVLVDMIKEREKLTVDDENPTSPIS